MSSKAIPKKLQPILWSTDVKLLDLEKNKGYIINQVLIYGTLDEIKWLFDTYSKREVIDVFINKPQKHYPRSTFYFVKNFILQLRDRKLDEEKYAAPISGPNVPRTVTIHKEK